MSPFEKELQKFLRARGYRLWHDDQMAVRNISYAGPPIFQVHFSPIPVSSKVSETKDEYDVRTGTTRHTVSIRLCADGTPASSWNRQGAS